ncbi:cupin [uncultured Croceitalea sp.]|uniref:cupin n=1 Tax=uncultured Croceitalea sp. TaxID=1798908 RepID=UPI00374EFF07
MKTAFIYNNLEYKEDKPAVTILLETSFTKEIRITLKKNQIMKEHHAPFPIVVHIIEGKIDFGVDNRILKLEKGGLIALESSVPHDLRAEEDSIIRLTLNKADKASRVEKVITK